jgi:hypothetical protein
MRHVFPVLAEFEETRWVDLKPGDDVYYTILNIKQLDRRPHGPFTVIDTVTGTLRNRQDVVFQALKWNIQLLRRLS